MNRTGCQENVNPFFLGIHQCIARPVDIILTTASQAADRRLGTTFTSDPLNGFKVTRRSNRESGFDNIDSQLHECLGHFNFLIGVHAATGRLLPVTQRGVENDDCLVVGGHRNYLCSMPVVSVRSNKKTLKSYERPQGFDRFVLNCLSANPKLSRKVAGSVGASSGDL